MTMGTSTIIKLMSTLSPSSKKGLEYCIGINVMETMTFIFNVFTSVIHSPLLFITQYSIGLPDFLELLFMVFLFCFRGPRVPIRMVCHCSLLISFLNIFFISILVHTKNFVVIFTLGLL